MEKKVSQVQCEIGDKKGNVSILLEFFDLAIMVTLNSSGTSNSKALGADRDATGGRCNTRILFYKKV